jgi:hypothetical protein
MVLAEIGGGNPPMKVKLLSGIFPNDVERPIKWAPKRYTNMKLVTPEPRRGFCRAEWQLVTLSK